MIIVIANTKGGVGKTTVAVHLAAWLHEQGHRVILADCDTQRSSSEWIRQAIPEILALKLDSPDEVLTELPRLREEADFIVADGCDRANAKDFGGNRTILGPRGPSVPMTTVPEA
jgi:chromosome partitioning protein